MRSVEAQFAIVVLLPRFHHAAGLCTTGYGQKSSIDEHRITSPYEGFCRGLVPRTNKAGEGTFWLWILVVSITVATAISHRLRICVGYRGSDDARALGQTELQRIVIGIDVA